MKLKTVDVEGLFNEYDYHIDLNRDLTFIHAPNGYGKSTVMSIVYSILSGDLGYLEDVPFVRVSLGFEDGTSVIASKDGGLKTSIVKDGIGEEASKEELSSIVPVVFLPSERIIIRRDGEIIDAMEYYMRELDGFDQEAYAVQIKAFEYVVNRIFVNKYIHVDEDGKVTVRMSNGTPIPVSKLSSGEKQIMLMFYTLVFHAGKGSITIIDEPEISLHVSWQQKLGDLFLRITEILDLQVVISTHSPQVIHDKWDYATELRREDA